MGRVSVICRRIPDGGHPAGKASMSLLHAGKQGGVKGHGRKGGVVGKGGEKMTKEHQL